MKAGRELDALVAEKVMGATVLGVHNGEGDYWEACGTGDLQGSRPVPPYSTSSSYACDVVKKMGEFGNAPDGDDMCFHFIDALYKVLKIKQSWDVDYMEIYTLMTASPESICLAALKAKGVKV